jgi:ketosteroid isomerase-like protein
MDAPKDALIQTTRRLVDAYERGDIDSFNELVCEDCVIADEGHLRDKAEEATYFARPDRRIN